MSVIGNFKKVGPDYVGEIVTREVQENNVRIVREDTSGSNVVPALRAIAAGRKSALAGPRQGEAGFNESM